MLSAKQGGIKYHFLSLWYDSTWDWTQVFRTTGEHSTHKTKWDRMFANGPRDLGSIPVCIIPKTIKTVLDTPLLTTQQYKVRIEGKV